MLEEGLRNACVLHEHLKVGGEVCRLRVVKKSHVFAGLVEACVEDAIEMVKEQEEAEVDGGGGDADEDEGD